MISNVLFLSHRFTSFFKRDLTLPQVSLVLALQCWRLNPEHWACWTNTLQLSSTRIPQLNILKSHSLSHSSFPCWLLINYPFLLSGAAIHLIQEFTGNHENNPIPGSLHLILEPGNPTKGMKFLTLGVLWIWRQGTDRLCPCLGCIRWP